MLYCHGILYTHHSKSGAMSCLIALFLCCFWTPSTQGICLPSKGWRPSLMVNVRWSHRSVRNVCICGWQGLGLLYWHPLFVQCCLGICTFGFTTRSNAGPLSFQSCKKAWNFFCNVSKGFFNHRVYWWFGLGWWFSLASIYAALRQGQGSQNFISLRCQFQWLNKGSIQYVHVEWLAWAEEIISEEMCHKISDCSAQHLDSRNINCFNLLLECKVFDKCCHLASKTSSASRRLWRQLSMCAWSFAKMARKDYISLG